MKWSGFALLIGGLIGTASAGFLYALEWATSTREQNFWLIYMLPLAGGVVGLVYHYFGQSVEAGNNLLIRTIQKPKERIPFLMAPFVFAGTIVSHLFGGSVGREGTALQMAGSIADQFSKPFGLTKKERKIAIIAAVAAGFGSVFATPLAGAVFALEFFIVGRVNYRAIFPAFLTAIVANEVTHLWQAHHATYHISSTPYISFKLMFYSLLAGVVFGLCAKLFVLFMQKMTVIYSRLISYAPLRPVVGGLLVVAGVLAIQSTKYIGLGIPTIQLAFSEQLPVYDFLLKIIFTVVTLAAGFKGGEVTPLFFIGATLGNALSLFLPIPLDVLSGMGFLAVFAGATNTPMACLLMGIEMFGVENAVYFAIASIVAYVVSGKSSIYSEQKMDEKM